MEFDYTLSYKEGAKGGSLTLYSSQREGAVRTALVRLSGRLAKMGHEELVRLLVERGGLSLVKSEPSIKEYFVRPDLASVVGSFMLLLRRSRRPSEWCKAFEEVIRGRAMVYGEGFAKFFELAVATSVELKRSIGKRAKGETVIPKVCDAFSASIKSFISFIAKHA